jgi:tetraacyldisaccharide 4'-kinase
MRVIHGGNRWRSFVRTFWDGGAGTTGVLLQAILFPFRLAYHAVIALRNFAYDRSWLPSERAPIPVVSIGNLSVGGTGKTPFARWIVDALLRRGARPAVLHGGYGADEPALHRRWHADVPVEVGKDRVASAHAAAAQGATVAVLDDGFQHRRLERALDIVLLAAEEWRGNVRLLPAGPWREPLSALERADLIVVTRRSASRAEAVSVADTVRARIHGKAIAIAAIRPSGWTRARQDVSAPSEPAVAVAAIARPDLFVTNATEAGARIVEVLSFPDHHAFTREDAERILSVASGRPILMTGKDAVKLVDPIAETDVWILEQAVEIEAGAVVVEQLLDKLLS